MKRTNVIITSVVAGAVLLFLCLVPVPISRIRGLALVQAHPDASAPVVLKRSAILTKLKVQPGDEVHQGEELAVFRDPDLEDKLAAARSEYDNTKLQLRLLEGQKGQTTDVSQRGKLEEQIAEVTGKRDKAKVQVATLHHIQEEELVLLAPRDGVIGQGPKIDEIGKLFEGARDQPQVQPIFTIHNPGQVRLLLPLVTSDYNQLRENLTAVEQENEKKGTQETLFVKVRIHGLDSSTWTGQVVHLDESDMKFVPPMLSNRNGGPVPVKPPSGKSQNLVPQTQHYLAFIDLIGSEKAIAVGAMAQVKISCRHETCLRWAWRTLNNVFNLRLL